MNEGYYLIKDQEFPGGMGFTIRIKGKTIENLTGDNNQLKKFDCNINDKGILASQNCLVFEITEKEAEDNVKNYESWKMLQAYVFTDSIKESPPNGMSAFH